MSESADTSLYEQSDEQILELSDDTSQVSAGVHDSTETQSQIAEQPQADKEQVQPELAQPGQQPKPQQTDKTQAKQPATPEQQQQELNAWKAGELDAIDAAVLTGSADDQYSVFRFIHQQSSEAFENLGWNWFCFMEQTNPQGFDRFSRIVTSDQLAADGLWDSLEFAHESARQAGDVRTMQILDAIAAGYHGKYGIGPATPEAQENSWKGYTKELNEWVYEDIGNAFKKAVGEQFATASKENQRLFMAEAHAQTERQLSAHLANNRKVIEALLELRNSYSKRAGDKVYREILRPAVRPLIDKIAKELVAEYGTGEGSIFKAVHALPQSRFAGRPQATTQPAQPANRFSMAQETQTKSIGQIAREQFGAPDESNPLTLENSRGMDWDSILSSNRSVKMPKPSKPHGVLDD